MERDDEKDLRLIVEKGEHANGEFFPVLDASDDEHTEINIPDELAILPLKNTVLFPGVIIPISVGREKSLQVIKKMYEENKPIGTVAQKDAKIEDPKTEDLYQIGTLSEIVKILEMPDGSTSVILQGKSRFKIKKMLHTEPYFWAQITPFFEKKIAKENKEYQAIVSSLKDLSLKIIKLSVQIPEEATFAIKNIENLNFLVNFIASNADADNATKQGLLEISNLKKRAEKLLSILTENIQKLELKNQIQSKVRSHIDKQQREYFLTQQIKTIQDELDGNPLEQEIEKLSEKAKKKKWSKEVNNHFEKELSRLKRMNPQIGEYSIQLSYLETLLELPWNEYTKDNFDLKRAKKILNKDHFGLDDVKDRILEYIAVLKLKGDLKTPIICLYGPPGVGKTSLGKSIADAIGRKYVRMSLGGVHDESEIRGHRRTYIGAMPGRIIENIRKAKSDNPVFVLDEIDKLGQSAHGDPASALLEVLDPEQNTSFHDNYLDLDYDLSKVLFIATANNTATIPAALQDRMEMINVSGYLLEEKIEIAKKHLIPKQLKDHGLSKQDLNFSKKILEKIIQEYTRESGVRILDKTIAKITRNIAKHIVMGDDYNKKLDTKTLVDILGYSKFSNEKYENNEYAGVVPGLAWTAYGGVILLVESTLSKGKGKITVTGNLGDVMKESVSVALNYIKAHAKELNIPHKAFDNWDLHVHFPEGATPKDGPSAGITLVTAITSAFTQRKIKKKLAMTGEITLRGKVLPIGGVKEKILAAKRAGIKEIILPKENEKDIKKIKEEYISGLQFHFVENIMDVLNTALLKQKVPNAKKIN